MKSDMSAITTSTVRRQSVRDLFEHYGIERPDGLVPDKSEPFEQDDMPYQPKSKIRCQNCSWYNPESSNWCNKCKMVLLTVRRVDSLSLVSPKGESNHARYIQDDIQPSSPDSSAKENQPTSSRRQPFQPGLAPLQNLNEVLPRSRKSSSPITKFPSFNMAQSLPERTSQTTSRKNTIPEQPLILQLLQGSRTTSVVKESPFLIADRLSRDMSFQVLPAAARMDGVHCLKTRSRKNENEASTTASTDADCESPGCRATHEDHDPYRHSVSCSLKKKRAQEETDNGYVADTSFVDDANQNHSLRSHKARPQMSNGCSNKSLISRRVEVSHQSLGSEFIECHGYPRTGHARHGSATSGVLGQCQHCIDDCQCSACRNTHHSVRCCMNENHKGMVHHHHRTSRAVSGAINPVECPTLSLQHIEPYQQSPLASPAGTASAAVPLPSQHKAIPPSTSEISQIQVIVQPPTKRPTLEKPRSLPRSKQGTLFKESARPPTPPPWVSNPKTKLPVTSQVSKLQAGRATADIALDVTPISDSLSLSKEGPTFPPTPTCDLKGPEQDKESAVRSWARMLSDHVPEHNHPNCTVLSCDQFGSKEKRSRSPRARFASRPSTTDSRKLSRKFSELFRFGEKHTVPLLNQRLLEHQEELRRIDKQCDDMIETLARSTGSYSADEQPKAAPRGEKVHKKERETRDAVFNSSNTKGKGKWCLSLVDKKPTRLCPNDAPVREHTLSDDETVPGLIKTRVQEHTLSDDETVPEEVKPRVQEHTLSDDDIVDEKIDISALGMRKTSTTKIEEHECVWRSKFVASQNENMNRDQREKECGDLLRGVTVVVHMEGKDDLVIEADLRKGRVIKAKGC